MTCPNEIEVNGEKYIKQCAITSGDKRIVVFQRGWVAVGTYDRDGDSCILENAAIIRKWGTTKGLGEIAANGPTPKTVLDPCPTIRFHRLTVVLTMDCNREHWK